MGDPKRQKKKYETPRFPWRTDILQEELKLLGQYGLRNKRELWRHKTMLSNFRGIARSLIGKLPEERAKMEKELLSRLKKLGMIHETAVLDDILDLTVEDILERRLQTIIFRKGLAKSMYQARQLITHGHIVIGDQRVTVPSYLVTKEEEEKIAYASDSPFSNPSHPLRQTITVASSPDKKSERPRREE
ncbi:30S ribosomal protein S4 [Candidatus Bathyarchaeota archaeon]|nr:30S ribosomal protein S4 [Candidatus Bathyarchaeota archaeon]